MNSSTEERMPIDYVLAAGGLLLLLVYLSVINFFNSASATGTSETISENLKFWGPIFETIIGLMFVGALIYAFVIALIDHDPARVLMIGYLVCIVSFLISILAKFFLSLLIADGMMGTAGLMGQIGVGVLGMSLGFTGEAFWLAIDAALSAFTAALFALGGSFLVIFSIFKK
jgi:hypothetical protein